MIVIAKMKGLKKMLPSAADFHYHSQRFGNDLSETAKPHFDGLKYAIEMFLIEPEVESRLIHVLDLVEETKSVGIYDSVPILAEIILYMRVQLLSTNPNTVYNTMILADTFMKNCGYRIHILIGRRIFMKTFGLVTRRHREGARVKTTDHYKVFTIGIDCIQAWGEAFISRNALYPHIYETYHKMRYKYHIPFPRVDFDPTRVPIFLGPITTKETQLVQYFPEVEDRDVLSTHHSTADGGNAQHSDDEGDAHLMDSHAHGYDSYEDAGHTNYYTLNPAPEEVEAARQAVKVVESSMVSRPGNEKQVWRVDDYSHLFSDGHHHVVAPVKPEPVRTTSTLSKVVDPFTAQSDTPMAFEVTLSPAKNHHADLLNLDSPVHTSSSLGSQQSVAFAADSVDMFEPCKDADLWWVVSKSSKSSKRARLEVREAPILVAVSAQASTAMEQDDAPFTPTRPDSVPPPPPLTVDTTHVASAAGGEEFSENSPSGCPLMLPSIDPPETFHTADHLSNLTHSILDQASALLFDAMTSQSQKGIELTQVLAFTNTPNSAPIVNASESAVVPYGTTVIKPTVSKTYTPEQFAANTVYRDTKKKPQLHAFSDIENSVNEMMRSASARSAAKPQPPVVTPLVAETKKVPLQPAHPQQLHPLMSDSSMKRVSTEKSPAVPRVSTRPKPCITKPPAAQVAAAAVEVSEPVVPEPVDPSAVAHSVSYDKPAKAHGRKPTPRPTSIVVRRGPAQPAVDPSLVAHSVSYPKPAKAHGRKPTPRPTSIVLKRKVVAAPATLDEFISYIHIDEVDTSHHVPNHLDLQMAIDLECNETEAILSVSEPVYDLSPSINKRNSKRIRAVSADVSRADHEMVVDHDHVMDSTSSVAAVSPSDVTLNASGASTECDSTPAIERLPHTLSEEPQRVDTPQPALLTERTGTYYLNQQRIKKQKALQFHDPSVDHNVDIKFFGVQRIVSKHPEGGEGHGHVHE